MMATYVGYEGSVPVLISPFIQLAKIRSHVLRVRYMAVIPSHLARFSALIGSSLGGLSFGVSFGANFLASSTCSVSGMAAACGISSVDETVGRSSACLRTDFLKVSNGYSRMSRQYWVPG